jgi:hypothetical protein
MRNCKLLSARITLRVVNREAVKANLRQYPDAARARVRTVVDAHRRLTLGYATDGAAVLTGWMRDHTDSELTEGGYGFRVGYRPSDFVGQVNTLVEPPIVIKAFYPKFVIGGTRRQAAQDNLTPALELDRPGFNADLHDALVPR